MKPLPTGRHVPSADDDSELASFQRRAEEVMGYSMVDTNLFQAHEQYERRWPGPDGPIDHLRWLVRRGDKQTQEAIDLGRKGGAK